MSSYFKNASWIFAEKSVRIVVTFILFALVSRVLGPKDFGVLTFAQTIAAMLLCITNLGLDNILIHKFSKGEAESKILSTAFIARLFFSFIVILVTIFSVTFSQVDLKNKIVLIICTVSLLFQTYNTYFSYFQAQQRASYITKLSFFSLLVTSVFKLYLIYIKANVFWFAISYTIDFAFAFIFFFIICQLKVIKIKMSDFSFHEFKGLMLLSWPIIASSVLVVLYTRLDQIMIMRMMGSEAVGIFNVAIRISEAYVFIPTALATAYYPLISQNTNKENICFYFDLIIASALIVGIGVIVSSYFLIPLLFGQAYTAAFPVLTVTVISSVFAVFGGACTNVMIIKNLTYMRLIRAVTGLLINLVLNLLLIPKHGIMGAAYSSLISQVFASWLSNILNKKSHDLFLFQTKTVLTLGVRGMLKFVNHKRAQRGT